MSDDVRVCESSTDDKQFRVYENVTCEEHS